jgi:hypothetical protein
MGTQTAILKRRKKVSEMLEDGIPIARICQLLDTTKQTLYKDWQDTEKEWMEEHGFLQHIPPHSVYRLSICTKIDLLTGLNYPQAYIAELLGISQSHVSKLKAWSEGNGMYGNTGIRVNVHTDLRTLDDEKAVPPATYFVYPMNEENAFLRSVDDRTSYIVRLADLAKRHTLASAYLRDYANVG